MYFILPFCVSGVSCFRVVCFFLLSCFWVMLSRFLCFESGLAFGFEVLFPVCVFFFFRFCYVPGMILFLGCLSM